MAETRVFECADCAHVWEVPFGTGRPGGCPSCQSKSFHRAQEAGAAAMVGRGRCRRNRHGGQSGRGRGHRGVKAGTQVEKQETNK